MSVEVVGLAIGLYMGALGGTPLGPRPDVFLSPSSPGFLDSCEQHAADIALSAAPMWRYGRCVRGFASELSCSAILTQAENS